MNRIAKIAAAAIFLGIIAMIALNFVNNPMEQKRAWLKKEIANVFVTEIQDESGRLDFYDWQSEIAKRPHLWTYLVPPPPEPPPPPPPPPAPPEPPNLEKMLAGVKPAKRIQIGEKIKIVLPDNPRGAFVAIGEEINGCTIRSFDDEVVTFTHYWEEGQRLLSIDIPRE